MAATFYDREREDRVDSDIYAYEQYLMENEPNDIFEDRWDTDSWSQPSARSPPFGPDVTVWSPFVDSD